MEFNAQIKYNKFEKEFKTARIVLTLRNPKLQCPPKVLFFKAILPIYCCTTGASLISGLT
jgi:hypothetical protein